MKQMTTMKKTTLLRTAAVLAVTAGSLLCSTTLTSCSSDNDEPENSLPDNEGRRVRQLTISEVPLTRATLTDQGTTLGAKWKEGDKATLMDLTPPIEELYGTFTATTATERSSFTGSISWEVLVGDRLALIYPEVSLATGNASFTVNLKGQKGTLSDVADRYHYIYGVAEVTAVTETTATANIFTMKPLLAVAKFTFKDKATNEAIPVKTLTISYGDDLDVGYPQTATVEPKEKPDELELTWEPQGDNGWEPLTITLGTETSDGVYVAMLPCTDEPIVFSVNGGTYTGTATATLQAGKYYPVALKLNKQN